VLEWHNEWQTWWQAQQPECDLSPESEPIPAEDAMDDASLFDSYNTEIPESLLEELEVLTKLVLDTSWMQEGLMDDDAAYFDACNTDIPDTSTMST
jgi:hypothetical protein